MLWFNGSIRCAVDKVKSSGVFLLVFVQGDDDLSKKYENYLNGETKFKYDEYVAIKIPHGTVALEQFKQIYVTVPIPSVFLIQNNGIPLNIISSADTSDIQIAINNVITKQRVKVENKNKTQLNKAEVQMQSQAESKSCKEPEQGLSKTSERVKNIGHKLLDVTEEELKKRLNEIRAFPRFLLIESPDSGDSSSIPYSPRKQQSARIQFRLPDNTMPSWEFPDQSTLADVRAYLMEKTRLSSHFKLLRTYPRTSFTPQDELKTLAELSLTPNATLILVPVEDKTVQARVRDFVLYDNFLSNVVETLLQPVYLVLNFLKKHLMKALGGGDTGPRRLPSDTGEEKIVNKKTSTSNIHGFKFEEDTDTDTEHPDNGNSTQQRFQ